EEEGYNVLAHSPDSAPWYGDAETTSRAFIDSSCDIINDFYSAIDEVSAWFLDTSNRDRAIEILVDELEADPANAAKSYDLYVEQAPPGINDPLEVAEGTLDMLVGFEEVDPDAIAPEEIVDISCVDG